MWHVTWKFKAKKKGKFRKCSTSVINGDVYPWLNDIKLNWEKYDDERFESFNRKQDEKKRNP